MKSIKFEVWILHGRWHQKMCESREEALKYVEENLGTAERIEVIPK